MAEIDLSKIKPGDEVTVRAKVVRTDTDYRGLRYVTFECPLEDPESDDRFGAALLSNVVSHTPALSVGDRVRIKCGVIEGVIRAEYGTAYLIEKATGAFYAAVAEDLERVP